MNAIMTVLWKWPNSNEFGNCSHSVHINLAYSPDVSPMCSIGNLEMFYPMNFFR